MESFFILKLLYRMAIDMTVGLDGMVVIALHLIADMFPDNEALAAVAAIAAKVFTWAIPLYFAIGGWLLLRWISSHEWDEINQDVAVIKHDLKKAAIHRTLPIFIVVALLFMATKTTTKV
jgi:MFS family permease